MDYPDGPKVIVRILKSARRRKKRQNQRDGSVRRIWLNFIGFENRRRET